MIDAIQQEINERLSEAEDEIIRNRINYMVNKDGFLNRLFSLDCMTHKRSGQTADNSKQELVDFLMDEMDIDG